MTNFEHEIAYLRKQCGDNTPYLPTVGNSMRMQITEGEGSGRITRLHDFWVTFEHLVALNEFRE